MRFDWFQLGDCAVFERSFAAEEFAAFSSLSGDANPLHHDPTYAADHGVDGETIAPLHMTLAPLSMIAGMIFPGEPSLYLGHEARALKPVRYGDRLRYSARITALNPERRALSLRVLALREAEVVLDATMSVQARYEEWEGEPSALIRRPDRREAVVTGAGGEIGAAIALTLAKRGWRLLLQDRGGDARRERLASAIEAAGSAARFVSADLATAEGRATLAEAARGLEAPGAIVHAASPPVDASDDALVAVNFTALKELAAAVAPQMLALQHGALALVGSTAMRAAPPGWEGYAGAKAMAANLIDGFDRRFSAYGLRGLTLAPGFVATRFSEAYRQSSDAALMPGEVAEALVEMLEETPQQQGNLLFLEAGRRERGRYGLLPAGATLAAPVATTTSTAPQPATAIAAETADVGDVERTMRAALGLPAGYDLAGARLGETPGWDSLRHIQMVLAIEERCGLRFSAGEIDAAQDHDALMALCARKRRAAGT